MNKDLTVGNPSSVLWRFCLPLFGSVIFQQLYNIADSLVAGKFIGEEALAAVGNSYEITLIYIAFAFGSNIGCSIIVSKLFGGKWYSELKTAVYTTFIAGAVLCAVLMSTGLFFGDSLLILINTPENIFDNSKLYLNIYTLGFAFVFFYNIATGIFSALGDSKTPFIFLAVSSVSNILVDILFVTVLKMEVAGVAWATFICQGVSCILAMIFVLKRLSKIKTDKKSPVFSWYLLGRIAAVAVPSILQQSFVSVGNIIIQGAINGFGSSVIAGYSAAIKLNNLVITSLQTVGTGISNYTAQNYGAGKLDRIREGFKAGIKFVSIICLPFFLFYFLLGRYLVFIFLDDPTSGAVDVGVLFLRIVSPFYFIIAIKLVADGILRSVGMMKQFMTTTFTDLVLRVVLALILSAGLNETGIWIAWPIGWTAAMVISMVFYRTKRWEKRAL